MLLFLPAHKSGCANLLGMLLRSNSCASRLFSAMRFCNSPVVSPFWTSSPAMSCSRCGICPHLHERAVQVSCCHRKPERLAQQGGHPPIKAPNPRAKAPHPRTKASSHSTTPPTAQIVNTQQGATEAAKGAAPQWPQMQRDATWARERGACGACAAAAFIILLLLLLFLLLLLLLLVALEAVRCRQCAN